MGQGEPNLTGGSGFDSELWIVKKANLPATLDSNAFFFTDSCPFSGIGEFDAASATNTCSTQCFKSSTGIHF